MRKAKIPIIVTACILLMLSLVGYLVIHKPPSGKDNPIHTDRGTAEASTVSSSAISNGNIDSSGNYTYFPPTYEYDNNKNSKEDQMPKNEPTKIPWTPATEMDLDPKSLTVYVNKEYCLPKNYEPDNLVVPNITFDTAGNSERKHMQKDAADAIELMFAAALEDGFTLYAISGYRSYNRQKEIFLNNIVHRGKRHTLKYSAAPGTSEHQTGLAMDVSSKSVRYKLVTSFSNCDEGKWLANHSYKFGFIIRYPKDQYDFTGYAYEPWHIRYVGKDLANYLYTNNMTLDEYYKYTPNEGFDYEEKYSNLINYKPPVTPTPIPEEELEENDPLDDLIDKDLEDDELDEDPDDDLDKDPDDDLEDDDLEDDDLDKDSDEDLEDDDSVDENEDGNLEDDELEENDASDKSPSPTPSPIPSPTPMPTKPPTDNSKEIDSSNLNNPPPSNPDTDVID